MSAVQLLALAFVAAAAPLVVLCRDPLRQALVLGFFGLALTALFFVLRAPDVALSQIVISTVALPLMVLLALAKIRKQEEEREDGEGE